MMDNVSNNNTLMKGIECQAKKEGITFNATLSCLWCMLHTVHLAVIKVWYITWED